MLNGQRTVKRGDAVIGLASSGLHTNGYSLARKIFFEQLKLKPTCRVPGLKGTIGEELLKVHVSYGPLVQKLLKKFNHNVLPTFRRKDQIKPEPPTNVGGTIKAFAHITGGGFVDNIPRVLPKNCDVVIHKGAWEVLPVSGSLPNAAACRKPSCIRFSTWALAWWPSCRRTRRMLC